MRNKFIHTQKEIYRIELVSAKFIARNWRLSSSPVTRETVNQNLFVELFEEVELERLFAQKIFSRN